MSHYRVWVIKKVPLYIEAETPTHAGTAALDEANYYDWTYATTIVESVSEIDEDDVP